MPALPGRTRYQPRKGPSIEIFDPQANCSSSDHHRIFISPRGFLGAVTSQSKIIPVQSIGGFLTGATFPLRAARFILAHPSLWPYCIMPLIINVAVVIWAWIWSGVYIDEWMQNHLQGLGWLWETLRFLAVAIGFLVRVGVALAVFVVVGSMASLPFNDLLSERADMIACGWRQTGKTSFRAKLSNLLITVSQEGRRIAGFAVISIVLFLLSWIPLFTPFITITQLFLSASFFAMDYLSFPLERRDVLLLRDKKAFIKQNHMVCLGFGACMTAIVLVPVVNFLFLPLGVVGGTLLHGSLAGCEPLPPRRLPDAKP